LSSPAPAGGAAYLCGASGVLLGGTDWQPEVVADRFAGTIIYSYLWDLPHGWKAGTLRPLLAERGRAEAMQGRELLVSRPLAREVDPGAALRAVVFSPQDYAVRPLLADLQFAAEAVVAAPFIVGIIWLLVRLIVRCCFWCCGGDDEEESAEKTPNS